MIDQSKVANVLSGLSCMVDDHQDARTARQQWAWAKTSKGVMQEAFPLINEMVVEISQQKRALRWLAQNLDLSLVGEKPEWMMQALRDSLAGDEPAGEGV
mgnify:CR=1 FL=1